MMMEEEKIKIEHMKLKSIENKYHVFLDQFFKIEMAFEQMSDFTFWATNNKEKKSRCLKIQNLNKKKIPMIVESLSLMHVGLEELKSSATKIDHFLVPFVVKNDLFNCIDELQILTEKLENRLDELISENRKIY